jgi:hypothetical protein
MDASFPGAPDHIRPIAGVRTWRVAPNLWSRMGGLLWASAMMEPWTTGEDHVAHCHMDPTHVPPVEGCTCGVYAYYDPLLVISGRGSLEDPRHVSGIVSGWGEILLHDSGWRAQLGRVEALFDHPLMPEVELPIPKEEIAAAYGAEIIYPIDYEEFCRKRDLDLIDYDAL